MCDWVAGQLIISFQDNDWAALDVLEDIGNLPELIYQENLNDRVTAAGHGELELRPELGYQAHLVSVPSNEETHYITLVHAAYQGRVATRAQEDGLPEDFLGPSWEPFNVQPNHLLGGRGAVLSSDLTFDTVHDTYQQMLGFPRNPAPTYTDQVKVLILDTGIANDLNASNFPLVSSVNFVDHTKARGEDDNGHGTIVALIINSLAVNAEFIIYKVADANERASEWDILAGLATNSGADIVNISLSFGLEPRKGSLFCAECGRESQESRSKVFETFVRRISSAGPIIVAAAGNFRGNPRFIKKAELGYPAKYQQVVAISSINSSGELSSFSRYGHYDQDGNVHDRRFLLPGGDDLTYPIESIGSFASKPDPIVGTSYAAAYASGFIAQLLAEVGVSSRVNGTFWNRLQQKASQSSIQNYDASMHGHGLLTFL